nr:hypothetical protein [uncultured bacterium]
MRTLLCILFGGLCSGAAGVYAQSCTTPQPVVADQNGLLSTGSFDSYQWYRNGNALSGATSQTHQASQDGNYKVRAGIRSQDFLYEPDGRKEALAGGFSIYPNPNSGSFTLRMGALPDKAVQLSLLDLSGKTLWTAELKPGQMEYTLQIPEYIQSGWYLLQATTGASLTSKSLLIK